MNIETRIADKQAELALTETEQQKLWKVYHEEEQRLISQFRDPWSASYGKCNKLRLEIEALESLAKEMGAV